MKKIGILTYHRAKNYGALLQAFSLVNKLNHDIVDAEFEIIDYVTLQTKKINWKNNIKTFISYGIKYGYLEFIRNCKMNRFSNSLPLSETHLVSDNAKKFFKQYANQYYAIIVGSDAVFNWNNKVFPVAYLLGENCSAKKISYAASAHGLQYSNISEDERQYCESAFSQFDYLGVRDKHTEKFIHFCNHELTTFHNCDPTMFLDIPSIMPKNFQNLLATKYKINFSRPIIFVMTKNTEIADRIVAKYGQEYEIISLFIPNKKISKCITHLSPFEWAAIFSFGLVTVTEYFHATILSLKNNTPVISFDNSSDEYEGKIKDLLCTRLHLNDFYYNFNHLCEESTWEKIYTVIGNAMDNGYTEAIQKAIEAEAENINDFENAFRKLLQ